MIVLPRPTLWDILFRIRGSIVRAVAPRLGAMLLVSVAAVLLAERNPPMLAQLGAIPFTLVGLALSIFMSFRNNACYDRWWEGRKLWGQLLIEVRAFARQTAHLAPDTRAPLLLGLIGFAHGLAARLRGKPEVAAIAPWAGPGGWEAEPNPTDAALRSVGRRCSALVQDGQISDIRYSVLEQPLSGLTQVQAGCERIKATPLPYAYSLLLHRTAYTFCLLLPFALARSLGWWTPLVALVVCYTFFGLDALGDEMEDPFGEETNDLPLDALVRTVEREMLAALGRSDLPPPLAPKADVLL
jgi:putative membrane protein